MKTEIGPSIGARSATTSFSGGRESVASGSTPFKSSVSSMPGVGIRGSESFSTASIGRSFGGERKSSFAPFKTNISVVNEGPARVNPSTLGEFKATSKIAEIKTLNSIGRPGVDAAKIGPDVRTAKRSIEIGTLDKLAKKTQDKKSAESTDGINSLHTETHPPKKDMLLDLERKVEQARITYDNTTVPRYERTSGEITVGGENADRPIPTYVHQVYRRRRLTEGMATNTPMQLRTTTDRANETTDVFTKTEPVLQPMQNNVRAYLNTLYAYSDAPKINKLKVTPLTVTEITPDVKNAIGIKIKNVARYKTSVANTADVRQATMTRNTEVVLLNASVNNIQEGDVPKKPIEEKFEVDPEANQARQVAIIASLKILAKENKNNQTELTGQAVAALLPNSPDDSLISEVVRKSKKDGSYSALKNAISKVGKIKSTTWIMSLVRSLTAVRRRPKVTEPVKKESVMLVLQSNDLDGAIEKAA